MCSPKGPRGSVSGSGQCLLQPLTSNLKAAVNCVNKSNSICEHWNVHFLSFSWVTKCLSFSPTPPQPFRNVETVSSSRAAVCQALYLTGGGQPGTHRAPSAGDCCAVTSPGLWAQGEAACSHWKVSVGPRLWLYEVLKPDVPRSHFRCGDPILGRLTVARPVTFPIGPTVTAVLWLSRLLGLDSEACRPCRSCLC